MGRPKTPSWREAKRAEHRRYYAQTAFLYLPRPWTEKEDKLVLAHEIPDRQLSARIHRSMKAISNRRWRLMKGANIENP